MLPWLVSESIPKRCADIDKQCLLAYAQKEKWLHRWKEEEQNVESVVGQKGLGWAVHKTNDNGKIGTFTKKEKGQSQWKEGITGWRWTNHADTEYWVTTTKREKRVKCSEAIRHVLFLSYSLLTCAAKPQATTWYSNRLDIGRCPKLHVKKRFHISNCVSSSYMIWIKNLELGNMLLTRILRNEWTTVVEGAIVGWAGQWLVVEVHVEWCFWDLVSWSVTVAPFLCGSTVNSIGRLPASKTFVVLELIKIGWMLCSAPNFSF